MADLFGNRWARGKAVSFADEPRVAGTELSPSARAPAMLLAAIVGASLVVGSVVVLAWVRMAEVQAGYEVYRLQRDKVRLRQERSALEVEIAALRRPDRLQRLAERYGLEAPPQERVLRAGEAR